MFDLDQIFSPYINILPYKQMFDRLAFSANKACASDKKQLTRNGIWVTSTYFVSGKRKKRCMGSLCLMFCQTLFARLATTRFV